MELITKAPKGTFDILPDKSNQWQIIEMVMRSEAEMNGFAEVRTPVFEHTELFLRGVGDTTDVVEKQMYTFEDKGGRSITLRPEGTAGAVRAMLESGLYNGGFPVKLYYNTTCYRYEKPQAGRLREFHQFGVEMFGAAEAAADAQVIAMAVSTIERLGLQNIGLKLNSIGCPTCRAEYHKALKEYFLGYKEELCETCVSRLDRNPMRILDCKSPVCAEIAKGAPKILDYICDDCREHFEQVQACLKAVDIDYEIDTSLVRGLDYYTRTVFEFVSNDIGAQGAVGGGGRYDGLVEQLGGNPTAGIGYAMGLDRIMLVMQAQGLELPEPEKCEVYIASMNKEANVRAFALTNDLHRCGVFADCDLCGRGLKAQMKYANKIGAKFTIVLGEEELAQNQAKMKNMKTGETTSVSLGDNFVDEYITVVTTAEDLSL
ncbi:histidine--tRNA ligase [Scatolibacter rhodanostii]|uniref:histidine--tRNA ligase n=1 Tax=Scatolibacter rhodanostii TaxID=2014781 RepID=UPI000C08DA8F|nr:histidine--tRNA ligase [Scatolibacter rhodanostii]